MSPLSKRYILPTQVFDLFLLFYNLIDFPFGQAPMLKIDGVTLCQSIAIFKYLASKYGMQVQRQMIDFILLPFNLTFSYENTNRLHVQKNLCHHESGLAGRNLLEDAQMDMIAHTINDLRVPFRAIVLDKDPKRKVKYLLQCFS